MYIAQKLKTENVAEYLLYMWQVEDLIRANALDVDKIDSAYIAYFGLTEEKRAEMRQWYADLIEMMRSEGVEEKGHLQINRNIIILLTDLHSELLKSPKHPFYSAAYYKALPFIVELRNKSNSTDKPELENCFDALYGLMMLRLQKKEISAETQRAMDDIAKLLGLLSDYYKKEKNGEEIF